MRKTRVTTISLVEKLSKYNTFNKGLIKRSKLIDLGEKLCEIRNQAKLTISDAAGLLDYEEKELLVIESGSVSELPFVKFEKIMSIYSDYLLRNKGANVHIEYTLTTEDESEHFSIEAENTNLSVVGENNS